MKIRLEHLPADVLGLSDIAKAALAEGPRFTPARVPRRPSEIPRPQDPLDITERGILARKIKAHLEPLRPPQRVITSINVLATGDVFAVVTGQQPGFLCSPLYSLYKAMQACRLAHELTLEWGLPVVPVFWNHADDHDVAEVHHAWVLNDNLDLSKVALAGMSSGRQPIGRILLDDERHHLGAVRGMLEQLGGDTPEARDALELFFPRAGESLARALTRTFTELLGEHGLVVVEPDWIRSEMSHALADIVAAGPGPLLAQGADDLAALGFEPAIDPRAAPLLYRVDEEGRHPLRSGGDGFRYAEEQGSRTPDELAAQIVQDPGGWSPAALLRPLVQDKVFPVAAYVGGFGELAYHAELGPLRERLELQSTAFVPRVSCTLVDGETRRAMETLDLDLREILRVRGELGADGPGDLPVVEAVRETTAKACAELLEHRAELHAIDPALAVNLKRTTRQLTALVEKVLAKAERVHANKSGRGRRHQRRVTNTLFPRGKPQERVLSPFQFTLRHGRGWVDALYDELPALSSEHLAVHLLTEETEGEE